MSENKLGIFFDIPNEVYHSGPELSASGLKLLQKSPAHYWARNIDLERKPSEPTPAMMFGTAVHCAILEPAELTKRYLVLPDGFTKHSNANKQLFADIIASGKTPISADDFLLLEKIKNKALANAILKSVFSQNFVVEASIYFERDGAPARCRPDIMVAPCPTFPNGIIVDVKSTTDASDDGFGKSSWNYNYHLQAEFYMDGFQQCFGTEKPPMFVFYVIETESPFADNNFIMDGDLLAYSKKENDRLVALFVQHNGTNNWPGYSKKARFLTVPGWAKKIIDESIGN